MKSFLVITILSCTIFNNIYSQLSQESILFKTESLMQNNVDNKELLMEYSFLDFSNLLTENNSALLGFMGADYQRIRIKMISVTKNPENPNKYIVYGKRKTHKEVYEFNGEIEVIHIREIIDSYKLELYEEAMKHGDYKTADWLKTPCYLLVAKCVFYEDSIKTNSGFFNGILVSQYYLKNNIACYPYFEIESDKFSNNSFVGTWSGYENKTIKKCNWGEYRIPNSGDLDVGVGLFSPNIKYLKRGWQSYYDANFNNDSTAIQKELNIWWE